MKYTPMTYHKVIIKSTKIMFTMSGQQLIKISFPFDKQTVEQVRNIQGRKYYPEGKFWSCPINEENVNRLKQYGFSIDDSITQMIQKSKELVEVNIIGLKHPLFPFQKIGVSFIESHGGRALLADEMGLGKTVQSLAWLQLHPEKRPVVIIVPASLKLNWNREIHSWIEENNIQILIGTKPYKLTGNIIILNYDILSEWVEVLKTIDPQVLILDECHYIKSSSAKRTKAVKKLAKNIPHLIFLSGTPIINRPIEGYNALHLLDHTLFPNWRYYTNHFCGAKYNGFGMDYNGASNTEELHQILTSTVMLRRKKNEVLAELPDKLYSYVPIELDNEEIYIKAETDFINFVRFQKGASAAEKASNAEAISKIEWLKQIAVQGKLQKAIQWIEDFLETGEKLVLFAHHKFVIDELIKHFGNIAVKIDGSTPNQDRIKNVDLFQTDPVIKLFIGNIKAAGIGITLTAASNVTFLELPWSPGDLDQAADRVHRIGQKNSVTVYYLLACDTIEEKIASLIDKKRIVLDAILDGQVTNEESLLSELINQYNQ